MSLELWLAFVAASAVMLVIPGPTILTVISYAVAHGRRAKLPLVAAVALGDSTALVVSLLGLGTLLAASAFWFTAVKLAGGLYLFISEKLRVDVTAMLILLALVLTGVLDTRQALSGFSITPVLAVVQPGFELVPNPAEVEKVFDVPLSFLMDPSNHEQGSGVWLGSERHYYRMPYEGHNIWGITAGIVRVIYERLYA